MFFGRTSSASSGGSFCRRTRFRRATATARFAAACPTMYLSSSRTISTNTSRSEEHTSELQSRLHLVCRLLLEKKKKTNVRACTHLDPWIHDATPFPQPSRHSIRVQPQHYGRRRKQTKYPRSSHASYALAQLYL